MGNVAEFFSKLHTITFCLLSILIFELALFIQSVSCYNWRRLHKHKAGATRSSSLLALIDAQRPATRYEGVGEWKECAVCLTRVEDGDEIRVLQCKHDFHKECLDQWLEREQVTCPMCRRHVLPEDVILKHKQLRSRDGFNQDSFLYIRW